MSSTVLINFDPWYLLQAEVKKSKILLGKAGIIKEDEEEEVYMFV